MVISAKYLRTYVHTYAHTVRSVHTLPSDLYVLYIPCMTKKKSVHTVPCHTVYMGWVPRKEELMETTEVDPTTDCNMDLIWTGDDLATSCDATRQANINTVCKNSGEYKNMTRAELLLKYRE